MVDTIITLLFMAAAVAAFSITVTKAILFKDLRKWAKRKSPLLGELLSCPFCLSFWAALAIVVGFGMKPISVESVFFDYLISTLILVTLTAPFSWLIFKCYSVMMPEDEGEPAP